MNDVISFNTNPRLSVNDDLRLFDRWGSVVYCTSTEKDMIWHGNSMSGKDLI